MHPVFRAAWLAIVISMPLSAPGWANGALDGRSFSGMIGPTENPDLADWLYFEDGHFWSDICTGCGFRPGTYTATETERGVAFTGTLQSEGRGRFDYRGLVTPDGQIEVAITWERRRWYWTTRRDIAFRGSAAEPANPESLRAVLTRMNNADPGANPLCARF